MVMKYLMYQVKENDGLVSYVISTKQDSKYNDAPFKTVGKGFTEQELLDNFLKHNGTKNLEDAVLTTLSAYELDFHGEDHLPVSYETLTKFRKKLIDLINLAR